MDASAASLKPVAGDSHRQNLEDTLVNNMRASRSLGGISSERDMVAASSSMYLAGESGAEQTSRFQTYYSPHHVPEAGETEADYSGLKKSISPLPLEGNLISNHQINALQEILNREYTARQQRKVWALVCNLTP